MNNNITQNLLNKKIHVIGIAGIEGSDIALFLKKIGCQEKDVVLHQLSDQEKFQKEFYRYNQGFSEEELSTRFEQLINSGFQLNFGKDYLKDIQDAEIIFAPQSWYIYPSNKELFNYQDKITTITNLYFQLIPCPIISVTGSNGKSTTTQLIYEIVKHSSKYKAWITGNDRSTPSLLLKLDDISPNDILVTETSNRQLNFLQGHKPHIAVITNITDNHLTEYDTFQDYANIKRKLFENQDQNDHLIINIDNPELNKLKDKPTTPQKHTISLEDNTTNAYLKDETFYYNNEEICTLDDINILGSHNHQNILQAITAAKLLNISNQEIKEALQNFYGLPNRCQLVHKKDNLTFINDRQGTAVDATVQAIKSLPKPLILIFGGMNKGMSTEEIGEMMNLPDVHNIGIKSPFTDELKPRLKNYTEVETMTEAVQKSQEIAETSFPNQKTIVLFSPGCEYGPYFNPLPGYEDAEKFNDLTKTL